jgi:DNA-directed RNA polymerase specialized sigma24 family protein
LPASAISKLAPRYRIVFHLRDIEGFSNKETAETLHLSLANVKSRLRRARLQLRDSLDNFFRERCQSVKGETGPIRRNTRLKAYGG